MLFEPNNILEELKKYLDEHYDGDAAYTEICAEMPIEDVECVSEDELPKEHVKARRSIFNTEPYRAKTVVSTGALPAVKKPIKPFRRRTADESAAEAADEAAPETSAKETANPIRHAVPELSALENQSEIGRAVPGAPTLDDFLKGLADGFRDTLFSMIDERGLTDAECYHRAYITRGHFSKIRNEKDYRPSKDTVLAFAIGLELDAAEAEKLLRSAGYALSDSSLSDMIIKFCLERGIYDFMQINNLLLEYDQRVFPLR